jgi:two-component system, chemotaxis family, chemotaxis protein CheY
MGRTTAANERPLLLRRHARVLIVDADADTRALYRRALPLAGCEVVEAVDGRDALTKALVEPPTLVITELRLPFVSGRALCEILRRDAATRAVPILIVTAEGRSSELDRIQTAGADAVLVKPAPPDAVVREVRRLIMRAANAHATAAPADDAAQSRSSGPIHSEEHRTVLARAHARFKTTTPPVPPPALTCPSCDQPMHYEHSHIGGVSNRHPEQWDYYRCPMCGTFQYRQRTRKVRHIP